MGMVPRKATPSSEAQIVSAIRQAWTEVFGTRPTIAQVGKTWAQIAVETGRGNSMYNYNVGNITWTPNHRGDYYITTDTMTVNNNPADRRKYQAKMRAYNNLYEGVADYLTLLKNRAPVAEALESGSVKDFSYALASVHYYDPYTRDDYRDKSGKKVMGYTSSLASIYKEFLGKRNVRVPQESSSNMLMSFFKRLGDLLDSLTREAGSIKVKSINKYGTEFPQNKYLISIDSDSDLSSKLEFARILSFALKEEIDADSETYTDGKDVEVQCVVNAEQNRGLHVIKELCSVLSDTFEYATKKIGGVKTNTFVLSNEDSCYQKLDIKLSETNYRKFQLKFIR